MRITIWKNGQHKTYLADAIDIETTDIQIPNNQGAMFFVSQETAHGITIGGEIDIQASFGENEITLTQPV